MRRSTRTSSRASGREKQGSSKPGSEPKGSTSSTTSSASRRKPSSRPEAVPVDPTPSGSGKRYSTRNSALGSSSDLTGIPSSNQSKRSIQNVETPIGSETSSNKRLRISSGKSSVASPTDNFDSSFDQDDDALTPDTSLDDEDPDDEDYFDDEDYTPPKVSKGKGKAVDMKPAESPSFTDDESENDCAKYGKYGKYRTMSKGKGKAKQTKPTELLSSTDGESEDNYSAKYDQYRAIYKGKGKEVMREEHLDDIGEDNYNSDDWDYQLDKNGRYCAVYKGKDKTVSHEEQQDDIEAPEISNDDEWDPSDLEIPDNEEAAPINWRRERTRNHLHDHHPELRLVWEGLENAPTIKPVEDPQPDGLTLTLLPFQKEGLHWMRKQEDGPWGGGILADEMGMGKTIQTIALMMNTPEAGPNLVVAPTVAIMQWKSEIEKYTNGALKVYVYHGSSKTSDLKLLSQHTVILTTYNLLESVFRKQESGYKRKGGVIKEESTLHKITYYRVVLDEAHNIKDRRCNTAKAVFALKTTRKLCLSGTPLQNRIGELFSLLRFLEVDPFAYYYCEKCPCKSLHWNFDGGARCASCSHTAMSHTCFFNYDLLKPIQTHGNTGEGKTAFQNIQTLLRHIMLRRTKHEREEDLGLPPKVVTIRRDNFSEEELDLYNSIYSDGKRKFDTYVATGVVLSNYANIFTLITRMRQMADHPDLVLRRKGEDNPNTLVCGLCEDEAEDTIKSKCHHTFCRDCVQRYISAFEGRSTPPCPKCRIGLVIDLTSAAIDADTGVKRDSIISRIDMTKWRSSTKIEALCEELFKLRKPHQTTKSIVFSQFTSMLQLIEWRLKRAGFNTVMLEGSMSPAQRDATIKYFSENVDVEVFLVSLKAGGIALNLIEANQVFLMEPWWNPSVEWQAADRIHRIGQTRVCRVTRMVIQDSIESRIVELQEKKANMIHATVNADQKAMDKLTTADMQFLFQN